MTKVLMFGTFDIVHEGHKQAFSQAATYGDELYVVISLDATVTQLKGREPHYKQEERRQHVQDIPEVTQALLGNPGDKYKVIEDIAPDVIALGYDQTFFVDKLENECHKRGLHPKIVKLDSHKPDQFKSSILRKQMDSSSQH